VARLALALALMPALAAACGADEKSREAGRSASDEADAPAAQSSCGPVEYGGDDRPQAVIASELPMQGAAKARSEQMVEAIRVELERRGWRAGSVRVGFKPCDDSLRKTGEWDRGRCEENARAYARDRKVIGLVGTTTPAAPKPCCQS